MVKAQITKFSSFLKSPAVVTTISAIALTPVILSTVARFGTSIPVIGDKMWAIFLLASLIVFVIAAQFSGMIQNILLGLTIGLAFNAFISTSIGANLVSRIRIPT